MHKIIPNTNPNLFHIGPEKLDENGEAVDVALIPIVGWAVALLDDSGTGETPIPITVAGWIRDKITVYDTRTKQWFMGDICGQGMTELLAYLRTR